VVVGIGASAGGLDALEKLFSLMPADSGLAFVVVQHLERRHPSLLTEMLGRRTRMRVTQAEHGVRPEPDHVYVIAPNTNLTVEQGALRVAPSSGETSPTRIDAFLRSLAADRGEDAMGVLLSGAGSDGTSGLRAVKEHGGFGIAQDPRTARHGSMPQTAIEAGVVDEVLAIEQMPAALVAHARHLASARRTAGATLDADIGAQLGNICTLLRQRTGHDFSGYKEGTLVRRIRRRVHVRQALSASDYLQILERDPGEPQRLLKDLLIGVTQFFRDPGTFETVHTEILPRILEGKPADVPVRIWVPGCASGEEAYSIAILVHEHLARETPRRFVQIFATDLDAGMVGEARAGRYSAEIDEHVSPERLERFFVRDGTGWHVGKELREMCIFSVHSLIRDPPFSALDLISCRNLLIYLEPDLQKKVIPLLHYALRRGGYLLLGSAEGLVNHGDLFETVDKKHRIFRRKETVVRPQVDFPISPRSAPRTFEASPAAPGPQQKATSAIERMLLDEYAPPCAVVNERGVIQFVAGRIGRFLAPPAGAPPTNLLDAVRDSLRVELRMALHSAASSGARIIRENIPVELEDAVHRVRLTVRPVPGADALFAVLVQERSLDEVEGLEGASSALVPPALEQIEAELRTTRADLKAAVESTEAANEELRSANEELISTNEELQSANEEMQTSKEELQSLNEELETVNTELQRNVEELGTANSDLQNLFASTEIATLFLDGDLRIARFTPSATELFHLIAGDVGRPLGDFAPRFDGQDLVAAAREVLRSLKPTERQVRAAEGTAWFILRIFPYRTVENVIGGVVITFVDISELKRAEEALRQSEERFRLLIEGVKDYAIFMLALDGTVATWNSGAERLKGYRAEEIIGQSFARFYPEEDVRAGKPSQELEVAAAEGRFEDEGWRVRKDGSRFWANVVITALRDEAGRLRGFGKVTRDFTERKRAEEELRAARERATWLARFPEENPDPVLRLSGDLTLLYFNDGARSALGELGLEQGRPAPEAIAEAAREALADRRRVSKELQCGGRFFSFNLSPIGAEVNVYGQDITERKRSEEALRQTTQQERFLAEVIENATTAFGVGAPDGRLLLFNRSFAELTGYSREELEQRRLTWTADLTPPEWREREAEILGKASRTGETARYEKEYIRKDGSRVPVELFVQPVLDSKGDVIQYRSFLTDISERKRAEEALRESEARYRLLFHNMLGGFAYCRILFDDRGRPNDFLYLEVNDSFTRLTGLKDVVDKKVTEVVPGMRESNPELFEIYGRVASTGQPEKFEAYLDGLGIWLSVAVYSPEKDHFIAVFDNITERKRSEEELKRSRFGLSRLAEASLRVVRETDLEGMLQAVSEAALALTGARNATCGHGYVSGRFMVGGSARAPGAPACPPGNMFLVEKGGVHMELVETADAIRLTDAELRDHPSWWGLSGEHVPLRGLLGVRLVDRQGRTSGLLLVTDKEQGEFSEEDESLLRQLATIASLALQHVEARISLEEADRGKSQFLAMLSHELRNPLAPIRNSLYILDRAAPGGEQAKHAQAVIERQVVHLTRLVDDLLDVTRISRGKIQLRRERLDLHDVVHRAVEDNRWLFEQNGVELQVSVPEVPLWIDGDRTRIAQVIGNLLHNSAKFTQPGGEAAVSVEANEEVGQAIVRVRDTGVGIAPEMLPRVFEPFAQADSTLDRSKGGLGLGLALVKGLVEMHGGTVSVESEGLGKGAEFTVRLPLESAELPPSAPLPGPAAGGPLRVLVIEDNVDAAESLREALELGEHTVEVAFSGADGIAKARAFRPDVVLCDIGLPGMDGYEVARTMRADPALRATRLVALTGYAGPEDVVRSREAGFDVHLAKPPTLEKIEEALAARAGDVQPARTRR